MDKFKDWLEKGSRGAEIFKQVLCSSIFLATFWSLINLGPQALKAISEMPGNYQVRRQKRIDHNERLEFIKAASKERIRIDFKFCKEFSKNRGSLIRCLDKINIEER